MADVHIKIQISKKRINAGDLRRAQKEDVEANLRLIASCMVNPITGEYYDREEALSILDTLDMETIETQIRPQFLDALEVARKAAVPPTIGGR